MTAEPPPAVERTPTVREDFLPEDWPAHRFGLVPDRWANLAGKVFWITGAGTGYGRAMSVALAAAGATAALTGRRREKLEETRREMAAFGVDPGRGLVAPCDVADPAAVDRCAADIAAAAGRLDGVVNNAATFVGGLGTAALSALTPEQWRRMFAVNVDAAWSVTRAALPPMIRGGSVRALFVSSGAGWASTPGLGHYNLTKAALNALGANFAAECAAAHPDVDVQINVINPGEARTEMNQGSTVSPYAVAGVALALLSHPPGGPNGRFFHRDGRHLRFCDARPWPRPLS